MSESTARASSALAITEKKVKCHRPGGCVGIFFQLFDWNRRFYRKKFFPKKLLPPARAKVSKKFNADEKLPVGKHLLIADENSGGFPSNMKKNADHRVGLEQKKRGVQAPGLVARLMGLETMPVNLMKEDKSGKSSPNSEGNTGGGRCGGGFDGSALSPEKGNVRPQKIQKTGIVEKRPITRLGAEALQIKNVLLRSRKHHHPKLASPVKSPKMGRNASRLLDAATRILEPGIQATNRARCSLTYTNSMIQPCKEAVRTEVRADVDLQTQPCPNSGVAQPNAQASCRSCGNLLGRVDAKSATEEYPMVYNSPGSNFREAFFHGLEESRPRPASYLANETEVVLLKTRYQPECVTAQLEDSRPVGNEVIRNGIHRSQDHNQMPANRMFTSQKGVSPSAILKDRTQRRSQMQLGDRVPPRSKLASTQGRRASSAMTAVSETKDSISLNRNVNRSRLIVPDKSDKSDTCVEAERRFCTGKNDPLATQRSPVRKRRTVNVNGQASNAGSTSSLLEKQRSNRGNVVTTNKTSSSSSVNRTYVKSRSANQRVSKDTDVVSFTFSSPVQSGTGATSHNEMDVRRRDQISSISNEKSQQKLKMTESPKKMPCQSSSTMSGDALGALLEQKLKELTHQVENEAATGFMPSARTTAMILQELISALTAEKPISDEDGTHGPETNESQSGTDSVDGDSQANLRIERTSNGVSRELDHFSPGCVLDASFSTDSCISSSIDDSSGHKPQPDHMHLPCDTVQPVCSEADLLDSASSANTSRGHNVIMVTDLLKHTARVLHNVDLVRARLTGAKLDYVQEVVLYTEMVFGTAGIHGSSSFVSFLIGPFLDELENLVKAAWKNTVILGFEVRKEENPIRRFLFDSVIECLDVKYNRHTNCGYRAWIRLPKCMNLDILIQLFDQEMRKWISVSGRSPDELIEGDMSTSLGKWTDFEIEAFETGAEISHNIVESLVDEMVVDFCGS